MTMHWKLPLVGVALAALVACNQRDPLSPSEQLGSSLGGPQSGDPDRAGQGQPVDKGNGTPRDSKLVFSFNLIGTPGDYEGGCGGGRRVFVERGSNSTILFRDHNDGWHIEKCDSTGNDQAEIHTDDMTAGDTLEVYARILGKPAGELHVCALTKEDFDSGETLCLLGTIDLTRGSGQSKFQIQSKLLFDASLEDIIWQVETNTDFRLAQFRVYETSPSQ